MGAYSTFGDALYQGSMGGQTLNKPVVGMAVDAATYGYWLVASDGGDFKIALRSSSFYLELASQRPGCRHGRHS